MTHYSSEDQLAAVAQSCKYFSRSGRGMSSMINPSAQGISCSACGRWNGSGCSNSAYDHIAANFFDVE